MLWLSNVVSCSVSLMLILAWGIDILFEKLTPEHGVDTNIFKIPAHFCLRRGSFPAFFL